VSQAVQFAMTAGTNRELCYEDYALDLAGERVVWGQQPVDVESRGVRWTVHYKPSTDGATGTREVSQTFLVEDGASVVVPRGDHPIRRLADQRVVLREPDESEIRIATSSGRQRQALTRSTGAFSRAGHSRHADAWVSSTDLADAGELVRRGNAVFMPFDVFSDSTVHALGQPLLDAAVDLLRKHGPRFLIKESLAEVFKASFPSLVASLSPVTSPVTSPVASLSPVASPSPSPSPSAPVPGADLTGRYAALHPAVRESLALDCLPGLMSQAMSGGVAVPLVPVLRRGSISHGFLHLQASVGAAPRLVDRLSLGDARLQRHHLRIETRQARVEVTATNKATVSPGDFTAGIGGVSVSQTAYQQFFHGDGAWQTFGPSTEIWTSAAVLAPHLIYEASVDLNLMFLRDSVPGQWAAIPAAVSRAARWLGGRMGEAVGWHRPGLPIDRSALTGLGLTVAGQATKGVTVLMAVPEPLARHQPLPAQVRRLASEAAKELRQASGRLRPSAQALGRAGFVPYSLDPAAMHDVVNQVTTALARTGGDLGWATVRSAHFAESLRYAVSNVRMGTRLNEFLAGDAYDISLGSISGMSADTAAQLRLEAALVGAKPLTWAKVSRTRSPSAIRGYAEGIASHGGGTFLNGYSVTGAVPSLGRFGGSYLVSDTAQAGNRLGGLVEAVDSEAFSRVGPMLFVSADVLVSVTIGTRTESLLTVGSDPARQEPAQSHQVDVRADDAAVVMIGWAEARRLGLSHPDGEATESGWHFPPVRPARAGIGEGSGDSGASTSPPTRFGEEELVGVFTDAGAEEALASAAQLLPAFRNWTLVSGQATRDGRLLLNGEVVDAHEVLRVLEEHPQGNFPSGLVLVIAKGLDLARTIAAETRKPVVATDGVPVLEPDRGVRTRTPNADGFDSKDPRGAPGSWILVSPQGEQTLLPADLAMALTSEEVIAAIAGAWPGADWSISGTSTDTAKQGWQGPVTAVTWPEPARRRVSLGWLMRMASQSETVMPGPGPGPEAASLPRRAGWWRAMFAHSLPDSTDQSWVQEGRTPAGTSASDVALTGGVIKGTAIPSDDDEWRRRRSGADSLGAVGSRIPGWSSDRESPVADVG
jgi:hypothetical protein